MWIAPELHQLAGVKTIIDKGRETAQHIKFSLDKHENQSHPARTTDVVAGIWERKTGVVYHLYKSFVLLYILKSWLQN